MDNATDKRLPKTDQTRPVDVETALKKLRRLIYLTLDDYKGEKHQLAIQAYTALAGKDESDDEV